MSHHREQLESSLRKQVSMVIQAGRGDPRIRGMISVTKVQMADEGRVAVVSVSVMPDQFESRSLHGLQASAGHVRKEVGKRLRIRKMPHLRFELDRGLKKQAELYAALREVADEQDPIPTDEDAETETNGPNESADEERRT